METTDKKSDRHAMPIFINKKKYDTSAETLTGREIKALAGYGDDFDLFLIDGEGDRAGSLVPDDKAVHIRAGLHFRALPRDRNFGRQPLHPDIEAQIVQLRALGHEVDVLVEGASIGLLLPAFPLPNALFNAPTTRLLLRLSTDPNSAMDMFWTSPDLRLISGGVPQAADAIEIHFGQPWRRFSWHWNRPWKPGRDNALTYIPFVEDRLGKGV